MYSPPLRSGLAFILAIPTEGRGRGILSEIIKKVIEEKIATLDKFIPYLDTSVEAFVEVALETRHHKKGNIYYAEVNIKVPGKIIR